MPVLFWRYVLLELVKTIALTTGVLVTVIAFGATIKPLASGLLSPGDVAKYVIFAIVPMLQFALPFAAGFGATIVLHRMANDNEILAASGAGMSHRRQLVPVLGLGLVMTLVMVILVQSVIPRFWVLLQETVTRDATRLFVSSLERGEAFQLSDRQIYASGYRPLATEPGSGIDTSFLLEGVAAAELDEHGVIQRVVTAAAARVDVLRHQGDSYIRIRMIDVVGFDIDGGTITFAPETNLPLRMPNTFEDEPKFMTRSRLHEVRDNPDSFRRIIREKKRLARALTTWILQEKMHRTLANGLSLEFAQGEVRVAVEASGLEEWRLVPAEGRPIIVRESRDGVPGREVRAQKGVLTREMSAMLDAEPSFSLHLIDCQVNDPAIGGGAFAQDPVTIPNLTVVGWKRADLTDLEAKDLLKRAEPLRDAQVSTTIERAATELERQSNRLQWEVKARITQRYALALMSLLLLLLGSVLAIRLRNSLPLIIYLWAFLPSILNILLISGGAQIMRDGHLLGGYATIWSGNALLTLLAVTTLWRISRN